MVIAVLLAVAVLPVLASNTVGGDGIARRVVLNLISIWVVVVVVFAVRFTLRRRNLGRRSRVTTR